MSDALEVLLGDQPVGRITALGGDRSVFTFHDAYADDPDRPVLSLAFKSESGGLRRDNSPTQTRLLPFFSNLLPEGVLREYLAKQFNLKPMREYPLLAALGADLPGAVTVRPVGAAGADVNDDGDDGDGDDRRAGGHHQALRFSLAGVQLKFSAVERAGRSLTIAANGRDGDWIVKLPSVRFRGVAANEFSMMRLARAVGLDVPDVDLLPVDEIDGLPEGLGRFEEDAFVIRRFDRAPGGQRIHIEDFAQVFGLYPDEKYEKGSYRSIARVLWLEIGDEGLREFIGRLVFNTLIGNADMHMKNWSLIYPDGRTPRLAPGYDFVATTAYLPDENMALKFARARRMADLTMDEVAYLAARAGAPESLARRAAAETVERFREAWGAEHRHLPIGGDVAAEVERLFGVVPIASGR